MRVSTALPLALAVAVVFTGAGLLASPAAGATAQPHGDGVAASTADPVAPPAELVGHAEPGATVDDAPRAAVDPASPFENETMVVHVDLRADGDAVWTVESQFELETAADVEHFESFAESVETGAVDGRYDRATFESFAALADAETDREMGIEDPRWSTAVDTATEVETVDAGPETEVGRLAFSVTWTGFAATDDGALSVQDAFLVDGAPWFGELVADEYFVIEAPPDHEYVDSPHGIDDRQLRWEGPHEFEAADFEVVLERGAGPLDALLESRLVLAGGVLLALSLVGAVGYLVVSRWGRVRRPSIPSVGVLERGSREDADPAPDGDGHAAADTRADPPETAAGPATGAAGSAAAGRSTGDDRGTDAVDPELLSDEERVHHLLEHNGGRMKQASIVDETGWSNAKVSQLLSEMDEAGEIDKLRIGRENLITLPEVDPTAAE